MKRVDAFKIWLFGRIFKMSCTDRFADQTDVQILRKTINIDQRNKIRIISISMSVVSGKIINIPNISVEKENSVRRIISWLRNLRQDCQILVDPSEM